MKKSSALAYVGHNANNDRVKHDFYATPTYATEILLKKEKFIGDIWECACGDGAISKVLINNGYDVYSSDLIDRGYGETGIDFLQSTKQVDNIVTNPPFNLATEFNLKALQAVTNKVVFLCKLSHLEGIKRSKVIFNQKKLKNIYVFSKRLNFTKDGTKANGLMSFGWFIYDVNYNGLPTIDWI
jgi:hypothetical protein